MVAIISWISPVATRRRSISALDKILRRSCCESRTARSDNGKLPLGFLSVFVVIVGAAIGSLCVSPACFEMRWRKLRRRASGRRRAVHICWLLPAGCARLRIVVIDPAVWRSGLFPVTHCVDNGVAGSRARRCEEGQIVPVAHRAASVRSAAVAARRSASRTTRL